MIVYFDEKRAAQVADDPDGVRDDEHGRSDRLPIVGSILALFESTDGRA